MKNGNIRFKLDPTSKKFHCSECGKKTFVAYIDDETKDYIPLKYGRCDRQMKCGYFLSPYPEYSRSVAQNDWKKGSSAEFQQQKCIKPLPVKAKAHIPVEVLTTIQCNYERNTFIQNLLNPPYSLPAKVLERVIAQYQLGTISNGFMSSAVAFPYIDKAGNIRAIQTKLFNGYNHTKKKGTFYIQSSIDEECKRTGKSLPNWLEPYTAQESKVDCLFGEHLLRKYPNNPVALVEAPKTAIYCTLFFGFPNNSGTLLWLATGGLSYLNYERCKVLTGRRVVLFPDLSLPKPGKASAFKVWSDKAIELNRKIPGACFIVSDLIEKQALPKHQKLGFDLADYLEAHNWQAFHSH